MRSRLQTVVSFVAPYPMRAMLLGLLSLIVGPLFAQTLLPFDSFGRWVKADQPLSVKRTPVGIMGGQAVIYGHKLYLIGGKRSDGKLSGTLATTLNGNVPDEWQGVGPQPGPIYLHAVADNSKAVYAIGGWDDHVRYSNIWCAPKEPTSDDLGTWIKISDYPTQTVLHSAVATENHLYVLGGADAQNRPVDLVRQAPISSGCSPFAVDQWQETGVKLPKALYRAAAVTYNNYVYITGGNDGVEAQSAIYYALVGSNGMLAGWQAGKSLPERLYDHQAVIAGGRLFILGGWDGTRISDKVYSIAIDKNSGALKGSWAAEPSLPTSLYRFAAVARPDGTGALYAIGGLHNDKEQTQVYYTVMNTPAPAPTNTPVTMPTPSSTPTAIPTPTPGLAWIQLQNEPDTVIAPGETIHYTIAYRNGNVPLENAVIVNVLPSQVEVVLESLQDNDNVFKIKPGVDQADHQLVWIADSALPTDTNNTISYRVRRTSSAPTGSISSKPKALSRSALALMYSAERALAYSSYISQTARLLGDSGEVIINPGAAIIWSYQGKTGTAQSNSTFNPAQKSFFPLIFK